MIKKTPKIILNKAKDIKIRLPILYKILMTIALLLLLILFYFVVITSNSPRSIKFVTEKIQDYLDKNYDKTITIEDSLINFTKYGSLKFSIKNVNIKYKTNAIINNEKKEYYKIQYIPLIESEISLFQIIRLKFNPKKIKIFNPKINIDNAYLANDTNLKANNDNFQITSMVSFLSSLVKTDNMIDYFEIENAEINIKNNNIESKLILRNAKIFTALSKNIMNMTIEANIFFTNNKTEAKFDSNCKVSVNDGLNCDINIFNLSLIAIADFHPLLADLKNINTSLNGNLGLIINNNKSLQKINFKLRADRGNFELKNYFFDKIDFQKMLIDGNFDLINKELVINKLDTNLISKIANQTEFINPNLSLSLIISNSEKNTNKYDFSLDINNVLMNELNRFWPINLSQNGIRDWVLNHITDGYMKKGFVKFVISKNENDFNLDEINAQIDFNNLNLNYNSSFPQINEANGIAFFSKKDMRIFIKTASVLDSSINNSEVIIDDFSLPENILSIKGKVSGKAGDGLKHAYNNQEFYKYVDKYLNGVAESDFQISIPISDNIALDKTFISVNSSIKNIKNDIANGEIIVSTTKNYGSNIFNTSIDLEKAEINQDLLKIYKKTGEKSILNLNIDAGKKSNLYFNNIYLSKNNSIEKNKNNANFIKGSASFSYQDFKPIKINIINNNFSNNINYQFDYNYNQSDAQRNITIKASNYNFADFQLSKFFNNKQGESNKILLKISMNDVLFKNNKKFKNLALNMFVNNGVILSGNLEADFDQNKSNKKNLILKVVNNSKKQPNLIEGNIRNIGYIAEAFGLSSLIGLGDGDIYIEQKFDKNKNLYFDGKFKLTSDIIIFENEKIKKLVQDSLISQVKDKIFSSNKTTFSSGLIDFVFKDQNLIINSMVFNNFKIGFTSRGNIDLANNVFNLKGMIIPGYIVNSLFGITKIPIIGNVISGLLTGEEGGGIFGIKYEYSKSSSDKEAKLNTNAVAFFVPSSISNLF